MKNLSFYIASMAVGALILMVGTVMAKPPVTGRAFNKGHYIYVESQDAFYETIVPITPDKGLPMNGPFQQIWPDGGPGDYPHTAVGPGDPGFVGGRWWVDANMNYEMDAGDVFFLCPLLGPGIPAALVLP